MLDSIPMVAITGNVPCSLIGKDSFQEIDITGVTLPITKHNYFVSKIEDLADTIREAFQIAKSGRPGPVLIDIPKDVQVGKYEYTPKAVVEKTPLPKVDSRRGQISTMEARTGGVEEIIAHVPLSEMFGYATDLRSKTQGRGIYSMEPSHFAEVPKSIQETIVKSRAKND